MNVELLLKVKEAILAKPGSYGQDCFCGTRHCIAGTAVEIARPWRGPEVNNNRPGAHAEREVAQLGRYLLGLDAGQSSRLTCEASEWPQPFCDDYFEYEAPEAQAKVAAARIDHFIATGGE